MLCIDLMHITPPVTAKGYDGSHHSRYAECAMLDSLLLVQIHILGKRENKVLMIPETIETNI